MLASSNKFVITENHDENMAITQFSWTVDDKNNAVLNWTWPVERNVKIAIILELDDFEKPLPTLENMLDGGYLYQVVTRDLASSFTVSIPEGQRKYLMYPGYFDDNRQVILYKPGYETDWMYRKAIIKPQVIYKNLPLSQYKKVTMKISAADKTVKLSEALAYTICRNGQVLGRYPIDNTIMSGNGHFYIQKDQTVGFLIDESYAHLLEVQ